MRSLAMGECRDSIAECGLGNAESIFGLQTVTARLKAGHRGRGVGFKSWIAD
jgi:hypothetical protein